MMWEDEKNMEERKKKGLRVIVLMVILEGIV